jgi:hypothetical protein
MAKKRRKRRSLKKLSTAERKINAKKWLLSPQFPKGSLLCSYTNRYVGNNLPGTWHNFSTLWE